MKKFAVLLAVAVLAVSSVAAFADTDALVGACIRSEEHTSELSHD